MRPLLMCVATLAATLSVAHCQISVFTSVMNAGAVRDASGNLYTFGYTDDPSFPATPGAFQTQFTRTPCGYYEGSVSALCVHGYVAKLNPSGLIVWCTFLEGSVQDQVFALALDSQGNIWVTGATQSPDFPITPNAMQSSPAYTFLSELSPDGSRLLYSTFVGGGHEQVFSINIDQHDKVYLFGYSESPTFTTTPGAYSAQPAGCSAQFLGLCLIEAYARKFDPVANQLAYSTLIGAVDSPTANLYEQALSAVDENGILYVAGYTARSDFPITQGVYSLPNGPVNVFVTAIDPLGASLVFSTVIGGSGDNLPSAIVRDGSGSIYIAGSCGPTNAWSGAFQTPSPDFPVTPDAMQSTFSPAFLMKLSPDASSLLYSTFVGRAGSGTRLELAFPQQIKVDADGRIQMLEYSQASDIPLNGDSYSPCYPSINQLDTDTWIHWSYIRFSPDLKQIAYATSVPSSHISPFFWDTSGNFYVGPASARPYFNVLDVSQAPHPGPVCIAESVTKTLTSAAPGLLMSIYGPGIGPGQPTWAAPIAGVIPGQLAGFQVLFDGLPAPVLYAGPNQIDVVVPFGAPTSGTTTISVLLNGSPVGTLTNGAVAANPFMFSVDGTGYGASAWYPDGTPNTPDNLAGPGDYLTFYGTGVGAAFAPLPDGSIPTSAHFSNGFVGGAACTETYAGDAPGQVEGIVQMNCQVVTALPPPQLAGRGLPARMSLSLNGNTYFSSDTNAVVFIATSGASASGRSVPEPTRQGQICRGINRGTVRPNCHAWGTNPPRPRYPQLAR